MEPKKESKTGGIVATVIAALLCGCTALFACIFGILGVAGVPLHTNISGVSTDYPIPVWLGIVLLCLSVIFIAVPIVVGVLTLRTKKPKEPAIVESQPPSEPLPPAS